ncbi:hypothetical protein [Pedobacter antarcticus]
MPTDTPMTTICNTIEINIKNLLNEEVNTAPAVSESFYIL